MDVAVTSWTTFWSFHELRKYKNPWICGEVGCGRCGVFGVLHSWVHDSEMSCVRYNTLFPGWWWGCDNMGRHGCCFPCLRAWPCPVWLCVEETVHGRVRNWICPCLLFTSVSETCSVVFLVCPGDLIFTRAWCDVWSFVLKMWKVYLCSEKRDSCNREYTELQSCILET